MKILLQIIAFIIPAAGMLQLLMFLGMVILVLKIMANSFVTCVDQSKVKRKAKADESNVWAIE